MPDPIWHHIFEPGIALIKTHLDVWNLAGPLDYRTVNEQHSRGFAAGTWMRTPAGVAPSPQQIVTVGDRAFSVVSARDGELVATFDQLCSAATSTIEHLHWSRTFRRWTITGIPPLADADPEAQQRFISLIDVLVDADVPVAFSSPVDLPGFLTNAAARPDAFSYGEPPPPPRGGPLRAPQPHRNRYRFVTSADSKTVHSSLSMSEALRIFVL
ncbi:AFG1/ZapE family ATPase [Microbacterium sp. NPDC055910]|uniref:AFG1/ZapE family ATPase n=1 Tax=Microbacterium sp. NPDC055910 TaxID=3345659 RepID=UPI0035DCF9D8